MATPPLLVQGLGTADAKVLSEKLVFHLIFQRVLMLDYFCKTNSYLWQVTSTVVDTILPTQKKKSTDVNFEGEALISQRT